MQSLRKKPMLQEFFPFPELRRLHKQQAADDKVDAKLFLALVAANFP